MENRDRNKARNMGVAKHASVQLPKLVENRGKQWVTFGENNLYPNFIAGLYQKDAIHAACVDAKVNATVGSGFTIDGKNKIPEFKTLPNGELISTRPNDYDSWEEVFAKVAHDYVVHGMYALQIVWNTTGDRISKVAHIDITTLRSGLEEEDNRVCKWWYAPNWERATGRRWIQPEAYPTFSPVKALEAVKQKEDSQTHQVLVYFDYASGLQYYSTPSYKSILEIQTDIQLSTYWLSNISNGVMPSMQINFCEGKPTTKEEEIDVLESIQEMYAGSEEAGKTIVTWSQSKETAPTVTLLQATNTDNFTTLKDKLVSVILSSHNITSPLLLGIQAGANGFSSNSEEIKTAWNQFLFTTVVPIQEKLLKTFNKVWKLKGNEGELSILQRVIFNEEEIKAPETATQTDNNK